MEWARNAGAKWSAVFESRSRSNNLFQDGDFMHKRLLSLVFCFLLPVIASAAAKRAFTIEDLYRIHGIEDLHVSSDGKTVLFTLQTSDLAKAKRIGHVWLMDADGRNARQFTSGEKGESSPTFSPDGKWIVFISARDGADNLYVISTERRRSPATYQYFHGRL